jgi:F420-dependent oxidoreductase-like protein
MRLGIQVDRFTYPGGDPAIAPTFGEVATRAEEAGFSSLWVMDHLMQLPHVGAIDEPILDAYAALSWAAAKTNRIELGTLVSSVTFREPAVLIKQVTTLDVLSGGRAWLGIGAGWFEREHTGLSLPFPSLSERFERLEENVRIAKQMWSGDTGPYAGKHYQLAETISRPLPMTKPHPPILIGGGGEKKTLRLVARYADACNLVAFRGYEELPRKLDVLRRHCEAEQRPYDEIRKTALDLLQISRDGGNGTVTPAQAIDRLGALSEIGFEETMLKVPNMSDLNVFDIFGEQIVPAAARL